MAFGVGMKREQPEQRELPTNYKEVAVKCWFTASGKSIPLMMKLQREDGEIVKVEGIHVITTERQYFAGIPNWKYRCETCIYGQMWEFTLLYGPEDCSWKLLT